MKILITLFNVVVCTLMIAVALLFVTPLLPLENNIELRIVQSGSMEPSIMTGAIVLIAPHNEYQVGDVITFKSSSAKVPTTHRIAEIYQEGGKSWFVTKGDANEEADTAAVAKSDILGTVMFDVPYAGFVLDFSRQPMGFFFLIVLPALLIIFSEIEKIWSEVRGKKKTGASIDKEGEVGDGTSPSPITPHQASTPARQMMDIANPVRFSQLSNRYASNERVESVPIMKQTVTLRYPTMSLEWKTFLVGLIIIALVIGANFITTTVSYPNDIEQSPNNQLAAVTLDFKAMPDGQIYSFIDGILADDIDGALVTVVAPEAGSVPVRYDISTEVTGTSSVLCDAIKAKSNSPFSYNGPLTDLASEDILFDEPWLVGLSVPAEGDLVSGDDCQLDVIYTAWYYDLETNQGYFDEERTPLSFTYLITTPVAAPEFRSITQELITSETDTEETPEVVDEKEQVDESESLERITESEKPEEKIETDAKEEIVAEEDVDDDSESETTSEERVVEQPVDEEDVVKKDIEVVEEKVEIKTGNTEDVFTEEEIVEPVIN